MLETYSALRELPSQGVMLIFVKPILRLYSYINTKEEGKGKDNDCHYWLRQGRIDGSDGAKDRTFLVPFPNRNPDMLHVSLL